jgi:hypothetical protein
MLMKETNCLGKRISVYRVSASDSRTCRKQKNTRMVMQNVRRGIEPSLKKQCTLNKPQNMLYVSRVKNDG